MTKETYAQRRANGMCTRCCKPSNKSLCPECMRKASEKQKEDVAFFKNLGLCKCGNKALPDQRSCQECLDKSRQWYKKTGRIKYIDNRRDRISTGVCATCGKSKTIGFLTCEECREKQKRRYHEFYDGYNCLK